MKKILFLLAALICNFIAVNVKAQCGVGYTNCALNWDYLQFFPSSGLGSYTNLAHSQTQRFAFGTQMLTITHNYASGLATGISTTHTGQTGSFGSGADVAFSGNGQIQVTFQTGVQNVRFSVYDIDRLQRVNVVSAGNVVNMARVSGTVLSFSGNGTASATGTSTNVSVATTSSDGTVNVTITGTAITSFTINITNSSGTSNDFFLSDMEACSPGTFTNNYFEVSKPFTNQGAYVLISKDNEVYYADALTGKAKRLFTAPFGGNDINAMAYDPVNHYVYYIRDNASPLASNKTLYRYHYDMDTMGVVINDITALLPTFDAGVESGGAAFYDGSLYFGVDLGSSSTYKCIIWRIDFDASSNPIVASQVFGIDGSGHDWGDFAVAKGMLYNFDGQAPSQENYHHQDLYSKSVVVYPATGTNIPKQTGVDWQSNIYSVGDETSTSPFRGNIIPYNENGTLNNPAKQLVNYNGVQITGQWRDGAEAFKPMVDFGDAPPSYDPIAGDPAAHEINPLLRFGANSSNEWTTRGQTAPANSDNFDDGMVMGSIVNPTAGTFFTQVSYFNNTGLPATICVWVDFNNNGVFDPSEGLMQTNLPSSASQQSAYFNWSGVSTTLTNGQYTYVRMRITTMSNGMTTANPTGFFDEGEVEDYRVIVTTFPLETNLISFNATKTASGEGSVTWEVGNEQTGVAYTVQRSSDSRNWTNIKSQQAVAQSQYNLYNFVDGKLGKGAVYYRLKMTSAGNTTYSEIRKLNFDGRMNVFVSPNPTSTIALVTLNTATRGSGKINLFDAAGRKVLSQPITVANGTNKFYVNVSTLQKGMYWLHVENDSAVSVHKLIIEK